MSLLHTLPSSSLTGSPEPCCPGWREGSHEKNSIVVGTRAPGQGGTREVSRTGRAARHCPSLSAYPVPLPHSSPLGSQGLRVRYPYQHPSTPHNLAPSPDLSAGLAGAHTEVKSASESVKPPLGIKAGPACVRARQRKRPRSDPLTTKPLSCLFWHVAPVTWSPAIVLGPSGVSAVRTRRLLV